MSEPDADRRAGMGALQDVIAAEDRPLDERIDRLLAVGRDYLGTEVGFLSTIDVPAGRFEVVAAVGDHDELRPGATSPLEYTYCRRAIDTEGPLGIAEATDHEIGDSAAYDRWELGCYIGVRVSVGGDLWGTLCFTDPDAREVQFTADERAFVELAAGWLGDQLERRGEQPEWRQIHRVLDRISDGFFATDDDWTVTFANGRFEELLGVAAEELVGQNLWETFPEAVERAFYDEYHRAMETGQPVRFEEHFPPLDTWFDVRAYPSDDGLSVYFRDVTDRVERERKLRRDATILETIREPVYALDEDWRFELVSEPLAERLGYDPATLHGERFETVLEAETATACREAARRLDADGRDSATREGWCQTADGERYPAAVELTALPETDGPGGVVGTIRDITGRRERERDLEFFREMVEKSGIGVLATGEDGTVRYANDGLAALLGEDRERLTERPVWDVVDGVEPDAYAATWQHLGLGETESFELGHDGPEGAMDLAVRATKHEVQGTEILFGTVVDVTPRRERERALSGLQRAAGDLLRADTRTEIAEHAVDAATGIVDAPFVTVYLYDRDDGVLRPAAVSGPASTERTELPTYSGGDGLLWETYVRGEPSAFDDVSEEPAVYDPETPVRSGWLLPLGAHGVMAYGDTERGTLPGGAGEFARTLAANVEVALDRAADREALERHEAELERRAARLERLDRVNEVVRGITEAVVGETTREGIERAACQRFAAIEQFEFAWVGRPRTGDGGVEPVESTGGGTAPVPAGGPPESGDHPATAALDTGDVQVRDHLLGGRREEPPRWLRRALDRGFRACCAVPFVYDGVTHGVLTVYAADPDAFDGDVDRVLSDLGRILGYALAAVERRTALASDGVRELAFRTGDAALPFVRLARSLDREVRFKRADVADADCATVTYAVACDDPDGLEDRIESEPGVAAARAVAVGDDRSLVETRLTGPWYGEAIAAVGGTVERAVADADGGRLTVRVPESTDVRRLVERIQRDYGGVELTAQRSADPRIGGPLDLAAALDDRLTERQRAALETAYHGGYFEQPRTASATELAGLLGVSQPTFSEHLRIAQDRVFGFLFDGGET